MNFEKHSAAQQYVDKLPEPTKKAIKEQRAVEGMNRNGGKVVKISESFCERRRHHRAFWPKRSEEWI